MADVDISKLVGSVAAAIQKDPDFLNDIKNDPTKAISAIAGTDISDEIVGSVLQGLASGAEKKGGQAADGGDMSELIGGLLSSFAGTSSDGDTSSEAGAVGEALKDLTGGDGKIDAGDVMNAVGDLFKGKK